MIKGIKKWFKTAKPNPSVEDACVQIGCHYEEVSEMAETIGSYDLAAKIEREANCFKDRYSGCVYRLDCDEDFNKVKLLDDLCDQIVTAVGVAHMLGMDIEGALNEVNNSNWSKFEDGKPVFNEQGKIAKGRDYFAPDLTKFIGSTNK
ncbi:putative phosphoribosyl-ATP pyrophosphohydrolase [Pseudoalteromonas phage TW1]|uniref:nucleotide pyrophosphohydrolase n=1 Tax=Pseudoalteromonas phage TW1 TaxID=1366055 RepID=UPI00035AAD3A|nr:nucleotide pyrophosphohydrolase [Pseudoalteromonas phage TW1]AGR46544.1 putative phosphoribosyl-ATP pyrophosphohydrolase [Pseudoalteromonas phage TW1]